MWKSRGRLWIAGAVAVALLLPGCSFGKSEEAPTSKVTIKGGQAGTYQLGSLTVTTTPKSVAKDTDLALTTPKYAKPNESPFGVNTVKFDLSLDGGKVQPAEPLDVSIPLKGDYLPPGGEPGQALLYTPAKSGKGLELVPATVDSKGVMHAKLYHLSPKFIAYPGDAELLQAAGIRPVVESKPDCKTTVKVNVGQVQFTTAKGWSAKPDSPIQACLDEKGGEAQLAITNRVNFLMAVATTNGLDLSKANSRTEDEIVARLAQLIFPDKRIKAYVGKDATLNAPLPASSLPATVELVADPSSFLAQIAWSSMKFIIAVRTAKSGSEVDELVGTVMDSPEVVDCLQDALNIGSGKTPSALEVLGLITSGCTDEIGKAVGQFTPNEALWKQFWNMFFGVVVGGIETVHQTLVTTFEGIRMQFVGTLRVGVGVARPERKLPEQCGTSNYVSAGGIAGRATVTVTKGSVGCGEAVRTARAFLGMEVGSSGANRVGIWGCNHLPDDNAICSSNKGEFTFVLS